MLKRLFRDERGSITPSIPILALILICIGVYHYGKMSVYQERTVVRDALDTAVTSALAGAADTKSKPKRYYEKLVCVKSHIEWKSRPAPLPPRRKVVCDLYEWQKRQSSSSTYVTLNRNQAKQLARQYFDANLAANLTHYKVKDFKFDYEYEDRYLTVTCDRDNTPKPSAWWGSDFGDSSPGGFSSHFSEEVRFPRWVKVTLTATVEIPVPMGKLIGWETTEFTWKSTAVKELK